MGVNEMAAHRCKRAGVRCQSRAEAGLGGTLHTEGLKRCSPGYGRAQDHCSYLRTVPSVNRKLKQFDLLEHAAKVLLFGVLP